MISPQTTCHTCGTALDAARHHGRCAVCLFAAAFGVAEEGGALGKIGRHELIEEIARGGMGVVYRARQREPERIVALKTMRGAELDSPAALARFRQEARAMADLEHPAILPVFAFGEHDGVPFFTMKLATGGTLAQRLADYAGKWREIAELVARVADAVQHAHTHAVLHRDLKPANILFDENGRAFVSDFGLAKLLDSTDATVTRTAAVMGTPHYLAPEIAAHDTRAATTASDVWSLGVILYELLAQRRPFAGDSISALLRAITDTEPASLHDVPRDLASIVMKALEKDRARRYETAGALAADLRHFLAHEPVSAAAPSAAYRFHKFARRNRAALSVAAAVAAILVGATVVSVRQALRADRAEKEVTAKLRDSYLAQARAIRFSGQPGRRTEGLDVLTKAAEIASGIDLRNEAIACLVLPDLRLARQGGDFSQPRGLVRTDGRHDRYAVARPDGSIDLCRLANDEPLLRLQGKDGTFPKWFCFSDDAQWLSVSFSDGTFRLMDCASGRARWELTAPSDGGFRVFLPNHQQVAIKKAGDRELAIHDLSTGEQVRSLPLPIPAEYVRFSPTGDAFAVNNQALKRVLILDTITGATLQTLQHADAVYDIAWDPAGERLGGVDDPGGQRLATACEGSGVHLWDAKTGRQIGRVGEAGTVNCIAFRPDGHILAGSDWDRTRIWDVGTRQQLAVIAITGNDLEFSADGSRLTCHGWTRETFRVFDVAGGNECRAIDLGQDSLALSACPRLGLLAAWGKGRAVLFNDEMRDAMVWFGLTQASFFFDPSGTDLFACNTGGLWRWPIVSRSGASLEYGPAQVLPFPQPERWKLTGDGQAFAGWSEDRLAIYDAATLTPRTSTPARLARTSMDTSPDGEWVATGCWDLPDVQIWNARTGKLVRELPSRGISIVSFSPDGRWLVVRNAERCQFWNVGTWTSHIQVENTPGDSGGCATVFTRDARIAALRTGRSNVLLIETATGKELARLESPEPHDIRALCFTDDDTKLVVALNKHHLRVWDLRRIRQHLAGMGLDWEAPPLPAQPSKPPVTRMKVIADPPPAK